MAAHANQDMTQRKPKIKKEGAKRHLVAFAASIILTILAFVAVAYDVVPAGFTVPFIIFLAIVQAFFQLYVWMHLDQKGHEFPRVGIYAGIFVIAFMIFTFVYWVW
ncbi:cytochrome C oxidase subunit IV [Brevibacillus sp. SYP-B805]|uniref:cytochrome C oxidase subunit IV family protein n=1 Tax=Brevibacillus sp. SYP-B805 TaxID=1578199 RepID=UPI0013EB8130|nr:cytochrome C oxidase subunit IV family protein [Brevibacillus sp. SYP-B805]NGQ95152.1 cytochrome C oxidase subunit IV [Brevibacillus sp. SYP-B805]